MNGYYEMFSESYDIVTYVFRQSSPENLMVD